jgi:hypothetical protein
MTSEGATDLKRLLLGIVLGACGLG